MLRDFMPGVYTRLHVRELHNWFVLRLEDPKLYVPGGWSKGSLISMYRALVSSGQPMGREILVKVHVNPLSAPKPFSTTRLGKLPQELHIQIYHELEATPPIHIRQELSTQGVRARTRSSYRPLKPSTAHVHLQASYLAVLRVCRSMYIEARVIFYGRQSYYTDNAKEFQQFVRLSVRTFLQPPFDSNVVTSLCVKNIVSWSDKKGHCLDYTTLISVFQLEKWRCLRKICFCMRVGEEMGYLEFLFHLPRMSRGVVDFLDDSHWVIRQQHSEEEWQLQYACFETNALLYKRGKNGEELSDEDIANQRRTLRAQSVALDLHDGSERYVEVQIEVRSDRVMRLDIQILRGRFSSLSLDE